LGCWYNNKAGCDKVTSPIAFEQFQGRRKKLDTRRYVDTNGQPV
jgi:hypothetical protein